MTGALELRLRRELENACVKGRRESEAACRAALGVLGVAAGRVPEHLDGDERKLRVGLRAKARQLGDADGSIELLIGECAYEQWHRLLFARFLAENDLLIHPEYKVPVTLSECDELAAELGEPDGWSVAGRFATAILPGIFRLDDPTVQLRLAPEGRQELEEIVEDLPEEVFLADDGLGWVYQFWQRDKKEEVNASERKIGGSDLGPVTQLFTEPYMVKFLLQNSLGAWWAARHPDSELVKEWDYLRFDDDGVHRAPAAGVFDQWPERTAEVTVMDPCCGSGHFLIEAFSMLWRMRAEEEGLSWVEAQDAVLHDNLFGLELDPRCVQIATFAVALQAWKAGGSWRELPVPNIACSGIPVKAPVDEWRGLANGDGRIENALVRLHILFRHADTLGSLINPRKIVEITDTTGLQSSFEDVEWDEISAVVPYALSSEAVDPGTSVLGADAISAVRAADFLTRDYVLICTNPPFLGRPKQGDILRDFSLIDHERGRHDLATTFLERLLNWSRDVAMVLPQGWTFLRRSSELRKNILHSRSIRCLVWLGESAFESEAAAGAFIVLSILSSDSPAQAWTSCLLDARSPQGPNEKAIAIKSQEIHYVVQNGQISNPEQRILPQLVTGETVRSIADSHQGIKTGDNPRFVRYIWEKDQFLSSWRRMQSAPLNTSPYTGREQVVFWEDGFGAMSGVTQAGAAFRGQAAWGGTGVVAAEMRSLYATLYTGELFDGTGTVIIPRDLRDLPALWAFLSSDRFYTSVRSIDNSLKITSGTVLDVPMDVDYWRKVATERFPQGLTEPGTTDPTQWLFGGRPEGSDHPLQVAVTRLLGYRWPEQTEADDLDEMADEDGIVCLPSVQGERSAADRLQEILALAYGTTWSPGRTVQLLSDSGSVEKDLESWLRDDFFKAHCKVFKNRPFIWHIWDGRKDGFSALVNYHRLDRATLERLTFTYLGDWIERQTAGVREDVLGAEERLAAARQLQRRLENILKGEDPYDIYVRWKSLAEQPMGWEPDLNDGVRLNVRPFVEAGVLRSKFTVKWGKDRGRDPDGSERHNHLHFTLAEKEAARLGAGS